MVRRSAVNRNLARQVASVRRGLRNYFCALSTTDHASVSKKE